jgi:hypothetical protein
VLKIVVRMLDRWKQRIQQCPVVNWPRRDNTGTSEDSMTTLVFRDRGWTVATAAWSAASKDDKTVTICYQWGADGIGFFDTATGTARKVLEIGMTDFVARLSRSGGLLDLSDISS